MEFQGSPLLSNEISGFDINDEAKNEKIINYKEIKKIAEQCLNMEELEPELLNKLIEKIEYYKGKKIKITYKFMEHK